MVIPAIPQEPASGKEGGHFAMGRVALTVHDLDLVADFYQRAVGLHLLTRDGEAAHLGAGRETLIELRRDASARQRGPREAGLFHTAFLLPARADLGRWTRNAAAARIPIVGASDHAVSEAIYLADPEGNGVEIYADRPASVWPHKDGEVKMPTEPLDFPGLLAAADDRPWSGFPEGSRVGHVHLQVGTIAPAEGFYAGVLGLDVTCRYPGGTFYATDGYHHHLATNIWNSRGAGPRDYPSTGLAELDIHIDPARAGAIRLRAEAVEAAAPEGFTLRDPWGTALRIRPAVAAI